MPSLSFGGLGFCHFCAAYLASHCCSGFCNVSQFNNKVATLNIVTLYYVLTNYYIYQLHALYIGYLKILLQENLKPLV